MRTSATPALISASELANSLDDPTVRVIEVDVNVSAYEDWHIDGAVLWNIYTDLKDAQYHPVDPASVEGLLERSGIGPESAVVCYGYAPALGFWLLKHLGHPDVRILNCSRQTSRTAGYPWTRTAPSPRPSTYLLGPVDGRLRACQAAHTCYFVSGRMKVVTDGGQEMEYGPGDFAIMDPGHDAWIVGDQPCFWSTGRASPTTPSRPSATTVDATGRSVAQSGPPPKVPQLSHDDLDYIAVRLLSRLHPRAAAESRVGPAPAGPVSLAAPLDVSACCRCGRGRFGLAAARPAGRGVRRRP